MKAWTFGEHNGQPDALWQLVEIQSPNHVVVSASENFSELMSKIEMFNLLDDRPPNIIIMRDPLKIKRQLHICK